MIEYINPSCISSVVTSCFESAMASSADIGDMGRVAAPFTEDVSSSAERESAIDENASMISLAPNPCVAPDLLVALREGEECVCDFLDHLSCEEFACSRQFLRGEADDDVSFVEIKSGITAVGDAESEGWTFADARARAKLSVETLAEGVVDTSQLPTCSSFFFIYHWLLFVAIIWWPSINFRS